MAVMLQAQSSERSAHEEQGHHLNKSVCVCAYTWFEAAHIGLYLRVKLNPEPCILSARPLAEHLQP